VGNFHHYCSPKAPLAAYCCTFEDRGGTSWNATHDDKLNSTEQELVKAIEAEIDDDFKNMSQWFVPGEKKAIDLSFYYPLLIYQGDVDIVSIKDNGQGTKDDLKVEMTCPPKTIPDIIS
jgi:hypothetical protein